MGVTSDSNLNINTNIDQKITKCNKMLGLIRRLSVYLLCNALLKIYKSFIKPYLDYGAILYEKPSNDNFQNKMEKIQYRIQLYNQLDLHALNKRRWHNKLVFFIKLQIVYYQTTSILI